MNEDNLKKLMKEHPEDFRKLAQELVIWIVELEKAIKTVGKAFENLLNNKEFKRKTENLSNETKKVNELIKYRNE